ncbi:hypothetical protein KVR01_008070 [Diaporthe batatas]|uniref:uncharacterized protein n=1 Tax=Diaporthe batatas TaxID=748121 RepID=UPI001D051B3F|nr:uncharacterized protein KVR01_008070 [Diaporthe batatas]KAG8162305.1 hypothetical protein KVR01_008070 [Diaporthe batatas]
MRISLLHLFSCFGALSAQARPSSDKSTLSSPLPPQTRDHQNTDIMSRAAKANQPEYYGPSQTALLFLDYQNVLFAMIPDEVTRQGVLNSAKQLLDTARNSNAVIIHCLIDTNIDPPPTSKIYDQWFQINKPALQANPELAKEHPELAPPSKSTNARELVSLRLPGPRSAFVNKDLLPLLQRKLGIKSLIIGGIATSGAVIGTALQGIDEGFVTTVVRDAVWDPNQQVHEDLLNVVLPVSGYVVSTQEAVGYLSK